MTEYIKLEELRKAFDIGEDCAECPYKVKDCCLESRPAAAICDIIGSLKIEYLTSGDDLKSEREYFRTKLMDAAAENARLRGIIDRMRSLCDRWKAEMEDDLR